MMPLTRVTSTQEIIMLMMRCRVGLERWIASCMIARRAQREREAKRKAEEQQERAAMLARLAEQERLDRLSAWQQRVRRAEHAREVEGLLAVKRGMQEAALVSKMQPFSKYSVA